MDLSEAARAECVWRDLRWVVESPSLVDRSDIVGPSPLGEEVPSHLADQLGALASDVRRVGHYFERLVAFWLREIRCVEVVSLGEQVRDGNRTIGELDCIFRDEAGVLTHWELTVKFFLHHPRAGELSDFPGPNATDNFEKKTQRLFEHQLPLSMQARPDVERRLALVRGCIFTHDRADGEYELPERMAPGHERGVWLRSSEVEASSLFADDARAAIMAKPHWLGHPAEHVPGGHVRTKLAEHFAGPAHPLMVSAELADGDLRRVVVVNDAWPDRLDAPAKTP